MKVKTLDLIGPTLDWAVAKVDGYDEGWLLRQIDNPDIRTRAIPSYSTDWAQGGPIIERERIETRYDRTGRFSEPWLASTLERMITGPTPLIAAMRCYVASKLGDVVEVPDELR